MSREIKLTLTLPHWLSGRLFGCFSKVDYKSKDTAEKAVRAMAEKFVKGLEPYECKYCGGWHIGHTRRP